MDSSIKVLFIGGLFLDSNKKRIEAYSKGAVQNAANKLQWNYIRGIEANLSMPIDLLNAIYIGTYPKYFLKLFVKGEGKYFDSDNRNVCDIGFVNLPIVAEKSKYVNIKKELRKWINKNKEYKKYIIAYGLFEQNVKALNFAKKFPQVTTCLIIPDLPQYMSLNRKLSGIRRLYLRHIDNIYNKCKKNIDYYSVITEQMGSYLKISRDRYVVIDGMTEKDSSNTSKMIESSISENKFSFLYTGGLSSSYGTDLLISEFLAMENKDVELWICGDGPYTDEIIKISKNDKRIRYFGILSQNECIALQHKASCLINPREDGDITPYSFPSKTMEYLMSGKPVIAKRLSGMGDEYANIFFQFGSSESLKEVMDRVSRMQSKILREVGDKGKVFVSTKKNNKYQTLKLIKMLSIKEVEQKE